MPTWAGPLIGRVVRPRAASFVRIPARVNRPAARGNGSDRALPPFGNSSLRAQMGDEAARGKRLQCTRAFVPHGR